MSIFSKQIFLGIAIKISAVHGPTITFLSHLLQTNHRTTVPVMKWINEVKKLEITHEMILTTISEKTACKEVSCTISSSENDIPLISPVFR